jgi:hypothetical protein
MEKYIRRGRSGATENELTERVLVGDGVSDGIVKNGAAYELSTIAPESATSYENHCSD